MISVDKEEFDSYKVIVSVLGCIVEVEVYLKAESKAHSNVKENNTYRQSLLTGKHIDELSYVYLLRSTAVFKTAVDYQINVKSNVGKTEFSKFFYYRQVDIRSRFAYIEAGFQHKVGVAIIIGYVKLYSVVLCQNTVDERCRQGDFHIRNHCGDSVDQSLDIEIDAEKSSDIYTAEHTLDRVHKAVDNEVNGQLGSHYSVFGDGLVLNVIAKHTEYQRQDAVHTAETTQKLVKV